MRFACPSIVCLALACSAFVIEAGAQHVRGGPSDIDVPHASAPTSPPHVSRPAVFRAGVDLVALNVVVTDHAQKLVGGLASNDFTVLEDGVRQEVSFFAATEVPLDLAILLDTSGSMGNKMLLVRQAATNFAATVRQGDRVMVVDIKRATRVLYPLGPDVAAAREAIGGTTAGGSTGLYNGLYVTMQELAKARRRSEHEIRRQAIVVLSDGMDTTSLMTFDDVLDVAKQSGIATYTITVRSKPTASRAAVAAPSEFSMKRLAAETGARAFFPLTIKELANVYDSIARELASQYALGYTPKNGAQDGTFRRIVVEVAARPGMRTRTRSGYTTPRAPRASE